MTSDAVVLVWAPEESRSEAIADRLGAEVLHVHFLKYKRPAYAAPKYVLMALSTLRQLARIRPSLVYVTNPPAFAALVVWLHCRFSSCRYVMDTHPPGIYARRWSWTVPLQRFTARRALCNVTDQEHFRRLIESWGTTCIVIQLPLQAPQPSRPGRADTVTVINTFAVDEPLEPVLEAAARLPSVTFDILGDVARAPRGMVEGAPPNVRFIGYLARADYADQLARAGVVVTLTTYDLSLMNSALDAMEAGKALVVSDTPCLREYFADSVVYCQNTGPSLASALEAALADREGHADAVVRWRDTLEARREEEFHRLEGLIAEAHDAEERRPHDQWPGLPVGWVKRPSGDSPRRWQLVLREVDQGRPSPAAGATRSSSRGVSHLDEGTV